MRIPIFTVLGSNHQDFQSIGTKFHIEDNSVVSEIGNRNQILDRCKFLFRLRMIICTSSVICMEFGRHLGNVVHSTSGVSDKQRK